MALFLGQFPVSKKEGLQNHLSPSLTRPEFLEHSSCMTEETLPWRSVFPELSTQAGPGFLLLGVRTKESLSQLALAQQTGIPQRHISEIENGKRPIGKERAKTLAAVLQVD